MTASLTFVTCEGKEYGAKTPMRNGISAACDYTIASISLNRGTVVGQGASA